MLKMQAEINSLKDKASQVDTLKEQVAFLMQMQMQNSRDKEKDDLRAVVNYLRTDENVSLIGLWGRSMGALTSLMYGAEDPSIAGMVLDSPFSDLVYLMMELVDTYRFRLPKFTVKHAIQYMRRTIQKKAKFDIMDLNTIKAAKSCYVPALLGHGIDDDFIRPQHSDRILEAYKGDRNIIKFDGDHNSPRPQFYFDSINIFFNNVLQPPEDELGESFFDFTNDYFGKDVWRSVHELSYENEPSSENKEPSTSTVDAIKQVHLKRPMSRMEEEKCDDFSSSSSTMLSFELSNGNLYDPRVPATLDDDQYVEYHLDDLTGIPSNAEEEQRVEQPPLKSSDKDDSHASSHEISKPMETESSLVKHSMHSAAQITNAAAFNVCEPSKAESNAASSPSSLDTSSGNTCSSHSDSSASSKCSSEIDISHKTKATLTVIRNPAGQVMNGLMRRWDFNFLRNSNKQLK